MVRLIKFGNKIKLLPSPPEGEVTCRNCGEEFDAISKRRACYDLCGHVSCLECICKRSDGCPECNLNDKQYSAIDRNDGGHQMTRIIENGHPITIDDEDDNQSDMDEESGIIVLSSVLKKHGKDNGDSFPEIERLSLSALPVLECMSSVTPASQMDLEEVVTPLVITLDDDEENDVEEIQERMEEQINDGAPLEEIEEQPSEQIEERHPEQIEERHPEQIEEDDDIQEVPIDEYTRLAGDEEDDDDWDVQSVTSHVTVIDPFQFSEDDDENAVSHEPTPRNLRKRRFSQLSLPASEEDEEEEEEEDEVDEEVVEEEENGKSDSGKYICKDCSSRFTKKLSLARHLAENHSERRPFSCTLCSWPFHTQRNLENHMLTHTNTRPFKCPHCNGAYNRKFTLDNHLRKIHGLIPTKRDKGQRSTQNSEVSINQNDEDESATASIEENTLNLLLSHSNSPTEKQPEEEDNHPAFQEEGPIPSPAFSSISNDSSEQKENKHAEDKGALLKQVYMKKSKVNRSRRQKRERCRNCTECKMKFNRKYNLDRHNKIAHLRQSKILAGNSKKKERENLNKYDCKVCDLRFPTKRKLMAHLKLKCKICGIETLGSLERHLEKSHGIRVRWREKIEEEERTENGGKYCPECQSLFGEEDLNEKVWYAECGHLSCMDCVIKADGLGCGQCTTERVRMEDILGRFFDGVEEKERRRILEVKVVLKRLEEEEGKWRNLEEAVKCKEQVEIVENFKIITTSNGARTFYCPYCKMEFKEKRVLGLHLTEMHSDKRPFACDICQWPFSSGKDLERHRIIHTNDKPFRCNLCPVTFNRKSTRDRHVEKVHLKWRRI